jgi:hypothetical protein
MYHFPAGGILYMASALGQTDGDASPIYGVIRQKR